MSNDGLSESEKVNLLFKNYMNFTTTSDTKKFFEETSLANNDNIFSNNILTNLPPTDPTYTNVTELSKLEEYLIYSGFTDISINQTWIDEKSGQSAPDTFSVNSTSDTERTVLRLTKVRLNYLGNGSAAFVCTDNNDVNILQNLIPSNYATNGYSISLHYLNSQNVLKPVGWLATRTELSGSGFIGETVEFGGALFDAKNGVVTFYDVDGEPSSVFSSRSEKFYLTASKYIGIKGISTIGTGGTKVESTPDNKLNFITSNILRATIDASGNTSFLSSDPNYVALDISATSGIKLPKGTTAERPDGNPDISGVIRYNTETKQFEGYATAWQGLGGVIDVNQDTKIMAENAPGENNDELKFFTKGTQRMIIDASSNIDISANLYVKERLDVSGATVLDSTLNLNDNFDISYGTFTVNATSGNTTTLGTLGVSGSVDLESTLDVASSTRLATTLDVSGATVLDSTLNLNDNFDISYGTFTVNALSGDTTTLGTLGVSGAVDLESTLDVASATRLATTLDVSGATVLDSTLNLNDNFDISYGTFTVNAVSGDTTTLGTLGVSGAVDLESTLDVASATRLATTLDVSGATVLDSTLNLNDNFDISYGTFTVNAASGNTKTLGTLGVSGAVDLDSTLDVEGATRLASTLDVSGATVIDGTVDINNDFKIASDKFTVDSSTGNTVIAGDLNLGTHYTYEAGTGHTRTTSTLGVSGAVDLDSTLDVEGATRLASTLDVSGATVLDNTLKVTGNTTLEGHLFGPAQFYIDPIPINDDSGTVIIRGNLQIDGTTTTINSTTVDVSDLTIQLGSNSSSQSQSNGAGIEVKHGGSIKYESATNIWELNIGTDVSGTLNVKDKTTLEADLEVKEGKFTVASGTGNTYVGGDLTINNNVDVGSGKFTVNAANGNTQTLGTLGVSGAVDLDSTLDVASSTQIAGATRLATTLDVSGAAVLDSTLNLNNNFDISYGTFTVNAASGNTTTLGTLSVSGAVDLDSTLDVASATRLATTLDVSGATVLDSTLNLNDNFDISYGTFTVNAVSGDTTTLGTLGVSGAVDLESTLNVASATRLATTLDVSGATVLDSTLNLNDNFDISYGTFTVNATSGDTRTLGKLDVSGETLIDNSLTILGNVGINISDPTCALDISATDAIRIPVGNNSQRPSDLKTGQIRFNTETSQFEGYNNNSSWQGLGGVIDIDQDTRITAESSPLDDNDELKFFTKNVERMQIDASGNIQMNLGDSNYIALDVSATTGIMLPKGTSAQRPIAGGRDTSIRSDISGAIRFNTDTNLCEMYTASEIWSALPVYKTEQPPKLLDISQTQLSENVIVGWNKFPEIYKDVFDGKSYPVYLQTFVDISFTNISNQSSNGWKTILIGNGNYDNQGNSTTPLTSVNFNSVVTRDFSNNTAYDLTDFTGKLNETDNLPVFRQDHSFDLRVYGVNNSGTLPNYIYINNVHLKRTAAPGPVEILNTTDIDKTSFNMDLSFNLDASDVTITSGISIAHYDISFSLSDTQSLANRTHSGNYLNHEWTNSTDLGKDNIQLPGLFPGAKYNIQIRAKNPLKYDLDGTLEGPTATEEYLYGEYGDVFESTGFTNIDTTKYIDTSDLGSDVDPDGLTMDLSGNSTINCYVNSTGKVRKDREILAVNVGSIVFSGMSKFYVNYGKQGKDRTDVTGSLVTATIDMIGASTTSESIEFTNSLTSIKSASAENYNFQSSALYTDEGTDPSNGFVYSATIEHVGGGNGVNVGHFVTAFPASTNKYSLSYTIESKAGNNYERLEQSDISSVTKTTGDFYVDSYDQQPTISFANNTDDPTLTVDLETSLFGITSITRLRASAEFTVSGFADQIIPHVGDTHSTIKGITTNCYTMSDFNITEISSSNDYIVDYSVTPTINVGTYDATTESVFQVDVNYLDNTSTAPSIETYSYNSKNYNNLGIVFRDSENVYTTDASLHFFDGINSISSQITPNNISGHGDFSTYKDSMLIRFNGKFVSGGYLGNDISGQSSITPYINWSSGYAGTAGEDYSNTSDIGGYKWIVLDVTNYKNGNEINLSGFKINGSDPVLANFGAANNGYVAYISFDNKFGSLARLNEVGQTSWFGSSPSSASISDANSVNGALQTSSADPLRYNGFVDLTTTSSIYLIVGLRYDENMYFEFT